jgi:hypothetical protein
MVDRHVRTANHEPLDRAIEQYLRSAPGPGNGVGRSRRRPEDRHRLSPSWRGPESPIAGAVAAIAALLAVAALAVRAIG